MSNFKKITKHPKTGEFQEAEWLDNYYGNGESSHVYGVRFPDSDTVYHELAHEWEFQPEPIKWREPKPEGQTDD